ncbi:MAG: insulinase family protein [Bacteriovoracaceae bacterium]|nr:insulinase family protein [Bacteriovoracaceae bacterium]
MKLIWLAAMLSFLGCANKDVKQGRSESDLIHFEVKEKLLDNGLKVLVVENHKLPLVSYYTYFDVGGKFETPGITGSSHFLEHMMFKGAKKYPEGEFDKMVEGSGGKNNAYTTSDMTVYYESLPSEHIKKIIDVEADRMQNLALNPKSFASEKNVVLEERKMRYENSDRGKIYLEMMTSMFEGTPYGIPVIGKIEDIKNVTRDQVFEYFKTFYAPNNAFIVIVGDVDSDEVIKEVESKFGDIPKNEKLKERKESIFKQNGGFDFKGKYGGRHIRLHGDTKDPVFMLGFKGVKVGPRIAYTLDILSSMLGDGESSYLSEKYVLARKPKLSNVYAANYTLLESGVFFIGGQLLNGVSINTVRNDLFKNLQRGCAQSLNERQLQKVKNQYLVSYLSGLDTNQGIAKFIGDRQAYYGDYDFYKKELATYQSINLEEVKKACKDYIVKDNAIFLSIWNKHKK